ncbi:hypothetical protein [Blastococcus litoris]|uniref:hypothetical protein n=1 Tax=Blastococcus litoris TaxID=2171622 RepID=UPI000E309888|nr:hypothetical protein [Blastococcus litoris]
MTIDFAKLAAATTVATDAAVRGGARCRIHGGSAPMVRRKAAEVVAEASIMEVARYYGVRATSPPSTRSPRSCTGLRHVDWLAAQIAHRPQDASLLAVYTAERNHLAKLADAMVRSNGGERRAALTERGVEAVELALVGTRRELGLDAGGDRVRRVFAQHLRAAQKGKTVSEQPQIVEAVASADDGLPEPVTF